MLTLIPAFMQKNRHASLLMIVAVIVAALFLHAPIPQLENYHHFANDCTWMGIANAENVLSNIPFFIVGLWGIIRLHRYVIVSHIERLCWMGFFTGVLLTCFGSAYYHLEPDNWRLVWDRLPIVLSFICLFSAVLAERVSERFVKICLLPFLLYSISAVFHWFFTEIADLSDMRAYLLVQLLPMVLIPLILKWYAPRYTHGWMLLMVALWYVVAKVCEGLDGVIYALNGHVSGHAIKHLFAALACFQVVLMLEKRTMKA